MQHTHTPTLLFGGHNTLWRTVKVLFLALAGLIAYFEHSPTFLVIVAVSIVLVIALTERIRKPVSEVSRNPQVSASRLIGDGGSFPGAKPEEEKKTASGTARVLDGGSLEHHRS